ncbi:MAG: hypothetical protein AAB263_00060 [Planctomycetota bacterium]
MSLEDFDNFIVNGILWVLRIIVVIFILGVILMVIQHFRERGTWKEWQKELDRPAYDKRSQYR